MLEWITNRKMKKEDQGPALSSSSTNAGIADSTTFTTRCVECHHVAHDSNFEFGKNSDPVSKSQKPQSHCSRVCNGGTEDYSKKEFRLPRVVNTTGVAGLVGVVSIERDRLLYNSWCNVLPCTRFSVEESNKGKKGSSDRELTGRRLIFLQRNFPFHGN
jgi:hypothetical protein